MKKVFIDAGHGGKDPGAVNGKIYEKDIALKIANKLNGILLGHGFKTQMTRNRDVSSSLMERCKKANKFKADIFISIHLNSSINRNASGIETFVYSLEANNKKLGECIQNKLINTTNAKNRSLKTMPQLAVLNSTHMPAALTEVGFISNEQEKELLITDTYQDKIAKAIAFGVFQYFGVEERFMEVQDFEQAINVLVEHGVINSPDYWIRAVGVVQHLEELIINMARKIA